ncbi:MAG: Bpu10I family restriction endonuclease [Chloroflexi bacterium]|nr:Bpu10I family restriction endonuclease [Chloroflexota bacterium]
MLVHGDNLTQKEKGDRKYSDETSRTLLKEIREQYSIWHDLNMELKGPLTDITEEDQAIIAERVRLLNNYKDFMDQQKYAEHFDSRSNLHSSVLEEFLYYLFKDMVGEISEHLLVGKSHSFKDIFFVPPNFKEMVKKPYARIETKDHDFIIGIRVELKMSNQGQSGILDQLFGGTETEIHLFDLPAVAIECKTYLDKTMLEGSSAAAEQLKARSPNAIYIVLMEWLKLTEAVNLRKYKVDQIYVLRKQKNTDREFRFAATYRKNPIHVDVVQHLFDAVRIHLSSDWKGGIEFGLLRGWLI